jgi:hypothetical protein
MDLFNNPMVQAARNQMTKEQQEEYARIGEHLFSDEALQVMESGKVRKASEEDLLTYALAALRSGLHPQELTPPEVMAVQKAKGPHWYKEFGWKKADVPDMSLMPRIISGPSDDSSRSTVLTPGPNRTSLREVEPISVSSLQVKGNKK